MSNGEPGGSPLPFIRVIAFRLFLGFGDREGLGASTLAAEADFDFVTFLELVEVGSVTIAHQDSRVAQVKAASSLVALDPNGAVIRID